MNIQRKNSAHHFRMQSEREQTLVRKITITVLYITQIPRLLSACVHWITIWAFMPANNICILPGKLCFPFFNILDHLAHQDVHRGC